MKRVVSAAIVGATFVACSNSINNFGDGGADGGTGIGSNQNVTPACQACLVQSSTNDCASRQTSCLNDAICETLNACVNKCANINSGCITNCGNAASQNAITEWNAWYSCTCADCGPQCDSTFCGVGTDAGSDANGTCAPDNQQCPSSGSCCSFCASDGFCGCEPSNEDCVTNSDCCSQACQGTCL